MSIVVDASLLVAGLVDTGTDGRWAEMGLESDALCAPELARVEAANILRRLEHARNLGPAQATGAYRDLMNLDLVLFPFDPFADRIWALRHNVTSYDAWYIAVAEALRLPLATLDRRLARISDVDCDFLLPPARL